MFSYRDCDPSISADTRDGTPIYRYATIHEIPWAEFASTPGSPVRIIIQPDPETLPLDVLYIPRNHKGLIVGFHGAAQQKTMQLPRFQFVRSLGKNRPESFLALSDSTMLQNEKFVVTWMVGNQNLDVAAAYAELIRSLMTTMKISECTLTGHSAGGTAAIRIGSMIPNSVAVVVNPQINAADHRAYLSKSLHRHIFPEFSSTNGMLHNLRDRLDLRVALNERAEGSRFAWYGHIKDRLQFTEHPHFLIACDWLGLSPKGGETENGDRLFRCNWQTTNGNTHGIPGKFEPFLNHALGEPTTFDFNFS